MANNNTLLNRMFSRKMLSDIIKTNYSEIYSSVISRYIASPENKTNRQLISEIYNILRNDYRNEYFYKNTILTLQVYVLMQIIMLLFFCSLKSPYYF